MINQDELLRMPSTASITVSVIIQDELLRMPTTAPTTPQDSSLLIKTSTFKEAQYELDRTHNRLESPVAYELWQ